jgi:nitroreductase
MTEAHFVPLTSYREYPVDEMERRAGAFYEELDRRRTVRQYSNRPVPLSVIEACLRAAGTAPSGANRQPWHFVVIQDASIKHQIRVAAEKEEKDFYEHRAPPDWLDALRPLGTDEHKEFLETAPYLIAVFAERYAVAADGERLTNYYVTESVGLATGMLIAALHHAGLVSLTHPPSPLGVLNDILERPANERPFLLLVVGYPAANAQVPDISRKQFDEFVSFV